MTKKSEKINYEELPEPEVLEMHDKFKKFIKILSALWSVCVVLLVVIPLFDFPGNQLITTFSYLYVFVGLIFLFMFEFYQERLYKMFSWVINRFFPGEK
ncbi:MAG: hypothetical protein Kow00108_06330 [Calditrichia bacterium]